MVKGVKEERVIFREFESEISQRRRTSEIK